MTDVVTSADDTIRTVIARLASSVAIGVWVVLIAGCTDRPPSSAAATLVVTPRSLDFGAVAAASTTTRTLSLSNGGGAALTLTSVRVTDDARSAFAASPVTKIAVGETVEVTVTYHPLSAGIDSATIAFETDSRTTPEVLVPLAGHVDGVLSQGDSGMVADASVSGDGGARADAGSSPDAGVSTDAGTPFDGGAPFSDGGSRLDGGGPAPDAGAVTSVVKVHLTGSLETISASLNGGPAVPVANNSVTPFATKLAPGAAYTVTTTGAVYGQMCTSANASGTVGSGDVTVEVQCSCPGSWQPLTSTQVEAYGFNHVPNSVVADGRLVVAAARGTDGQTSHLIKPLDGGTVVSLNWPKPTDHGDSAVVWVPDAKRAFACSTTDTCFVINPETGLVTVANALGHPTISYETEMVVIGASVLVSNLPTSERAIYSIAADQWATVPQPPFDAGCCSAMAYTGTEVLSYGGIGHRRMFAYDPTNKLWSERFTDGGPTWVPTSSPWGYNQYYGTMSAGEYVVIAPNSTGGRYNPTSNTWVGLPDAGGGDLSTGSYTYLPSDDGVAMVKTDLDTGVVGTRWTRATDRWQNFSAVNAPQLRRHPVTALTPTGLVMWGATPNKFGTRTIQSGLVYEWASATDTWSNDGVTPSPYVASHGGSSGGSAGMSWSPALMKPFLMSNGFGQSVGAVFDPTSRTWSSLPAPNWSSPTYHVMTAAGGTWLFVTAGGGYTFNTTNNTWVAWPVALNNVLKANSAYGDEPVLAYAANRLVIWLGTATYVLNPTDNTFVQASNAGAPAATYSFSAAWAVIDGQRVAVWGGLATDSMTLRNTGALYDVASDTWAPMSTTGAPSPRYGASATWTGSEFAVYGGNTSHTSSTGDTVLGLYDPTTDRWRTVTAPSFVGTQLYNAVAWSGSKVMLFNGGGTGAVTSGAQFDPVANAFTCMAAENAPGWRTRPLALWVGDRLMVYAGSNSGSDTGGLYTP